MCIIYILRVAYLAQDVFPSFEYVEFFDFIKGFKKRTVDTLRMFYRVEKRGDGRWVVLIFSTLHTFSFVATMQWHVLSLIWKNIRNTRFRGWFTLLLRSEFWYGHPNCHFWYSPKRPKWAILAIFGYFGGTKIGTLVA